MKYKLFFLHFSIFVALTFNLWSYETNCLNEVPPWPPDCPECDGSVGSNPIHAGTANLHREITDLTTYGNAPVEFQRIFNSRTLNFNPSYWEFGAENTWQHNWNYEMRDLTSQTIGHKDIKLRYPDGEEYNFKAVDDQGTQRAPMAHIGDRLYKWDGNQVGHTLVTPDGWEYDFKRTLSPKYRLERVRNGQGLTWYLEYDGNQRLIKIKNDFGRWIAIERENINGVERIKKILSNDGREVIYQYDIWPATGDTVLTEVHYPKEGKDGEKTEYTYCGGSSLNTGRPLLRTANDPLYEGQGAKMKYSYNYNFIFDFGQGDYLVTGIILEERNLETDQLIVALPLGGGPYPQILSGNGSEITQKFKNGLGVESWDEEGRKTIVTRDQNGFGYINSVTHPGGEVTSYAKDFAGRILAETNALGSVKTFVYNDAGFLISETDELNRTTTYQFNDKNWLIKKTYPNGSYEEWTHDIYGQPLTYRQRNGSIIHYAYYSENETGGMKGDLKTITDPLGNVTTYTHDTAGNLASITDALNHKTQHTYNWRGQVTTITYADETQVHFAYDQFGNRTNVINELGHATIYIYDEYNRVKTVTDPLNRITEYEYGLEPGCGSCADKDTISKITLPSGKRIEYTYDKSGLRLSQIVGAQSEKEQAITFYSYDNDKNLKTLTDPNGNTLTYHYDLLNRRTKQVDSLGNITSWTYDAVGNRLTETLPDNSVTTYYYDEMNRVTNTIDANGAITQMKYDLSDNLKELVDAKNHTYTYFYDKLNRREGLEYPDSSVEYWNYDSVGNLETYITREGYTCTYLYDNRNRLKQSTWDDGKTPKITRDYDVAGRLKTLTTHYPSPVTLTYDYDAANQLLSETTEISDQLSAFSIQYGYDADGNRKTLTYPDGTLLDYNYTERNELKNISQNGQLFVNYDHDKAGNRLTKTLTPSDISQVATYDYDLVHRLKTIIHTSDKAVFNTINYTYNSANNITSRQQKAKLSSLVNYQYDKIAQLTNAVYNEGKRKVNYQWDEVGNRQQVNDTDLAQPTTYQANHLNQYSEAVSDQLLAFSYDGNGNLATENTENIQKTYSYDSQNRLTSFSSVNSVAQFVYDARNRVIQREINGEPIYLIYDNWNLIAEYNAKGQLAARYIHGARTDELLSRTDKETEETVYYHHDALGNVTHLTNPKGQVIESYQYDAFGEPQIYNSNHQPLVTSHYNNRFLFTGREYLKELGLYDYRNRVYSPNLGRFLQTDPIRFEAGDINLYRYVANNSVNFIDPLGLRRWGSRCCRYVPTAVEYEKRKIEEAAVAWNTTSPGWSWNNQCGQQAAGLVAYIQRIRPRIRLWYPRVVGGSRGKIFGMQYGHHQVVEVKPIAGVEKCGFKSFLLDPFKGICRNWSGNVEILTVEEFQIKYPLPHPQNNWYPGGW